MAKGYGLTGKIQGKLGSKVYRIEAGEQIISEYNPNKQDPKSEKQLIQRSKVVVANEVSKVFPWEVLVGWSTNRTKARRDFVGDLVRLATTTGTAEEKVSAIDVTKIQLSKGIPVLVMNSSFNNTSVQGTTYVNSYLYVGLHSEVSAYLFVVAFENATTGKLQRAYYVMSSEKNNEGRIQAHINVSEIVGLSGYKAYGYAVPVVPNTLKKKVVYEKSVVESSDNHISATTLVTLARAELFEATIYLGEVNFM